MLDKLMNGPNSERMPVLFIGHGSPMNAIDSNPYTKTLNSLGEKLPKPKAILVISAHWMTEGSWITEMPKPKTIHDFYGFPQELFDVQYPAPGSPEIAKFIRESVQHPRIHADTEMWGLDHGTWSVLRHLYPAADIPVLQLSLHMEKPVEYHIELGKQLSQLRDKGILILGSGNLVHNLRTIRWEPNAQPYDWAVEYDEWLKARLLDRDFSAVLNDFHRTEAGKMSIPTMEHYYPLHYVLGAADSADELKFEYEELQNGSISMRSFSLGRG
ncbi:4,5-DOPA-extradiol-dioxygenase [Bdellovibrio reynosensis]|uniref:4,5-DOPA dioxygenase extradiol n=1 Tax=Bdellovibrio reynosensis TaxID=2835041 RepID=A0ABY4CFW7_9BACT|nr:4,5-DOPA dioxygenase extradiol [Bdellovibrio reynosensis]UOF02443.1 4,5-DOPA dioxygenase extradiol [Bdellovibrio reynosensis]